jgi:hypothetical protein
MDSFTNGSVLWQLVDVRGVAGGGDPLPVWLAGINGVVQKSISTTTSGIRKGIDQAFYQSPYIQGDDTKRREGSS